MAGRSHSGRAAALLCAGLVGALVVAGCGKSGTSGGSSGTSAGGASAQQKDSALNAMLPAKIKSAGKIVVAVDPSYAPNEFFGPDNKTIVGMDPDLGKALGEVLGVKFEFTKATFDAIIPGLASGRYDLGMSSFTDSKEREKTVDFVTYLSAGTSLMVKKGNPQKLSTDDNSLCGKKVAVEKGTVQESPDISDRTKKCTAAGKPAVQALVYPDQNGANLALTSGRADAVLADSPPVEYAVKQSNGQFEVVGKTYGTAPYGIAMPKNQGKLPDAIKGALDKLIANGAYKKVLARWGIESGAITTPQINGAQS